MLKNTPLSNAVHQALFSSAVLLVSSLIAQSAHAELIIHTSKDANGQTSMVVNQDRQKDLPPAQLGITPSFIQESVSLKQNKNTSRLNQSLTLYNYGTKPKKIRLNLVDMDASGKPVEPSETTLKPWTLINPTEFTITPGGYQTVRMAMRLPLEFPAGKHAAMLSIEQQVDKSLTYDADGKGVTLEIGSRYGLPVFINVE
uniref:Molecular chaperone n=1 Tax=Psychrobacter sp. (strain PRwf-1) TaxID=349106 RepID=A5WCT1_PSYWF